jgi:beta-lysine 5,6-aminomutase alpha subunit
MNAAGNLAEDFHPAPDGFIATRARQVLAESIDLLERIVEGHGAARHGGLLDAIADGTFGLMKRPADGGRGLDGVAAKAPGYYNPATEILEER